MKLNRIIIIILAVILSSCGRTVYDCDCEVNGVYSYTLHDVKNRECVQQRNDSTVCEYVLVNIM